MKLCSINCETKSHNLPLATYISGKIIFHSLIYTVSFYWVASCAVSIKSTEDGWESHLKSGNTNHRFICLVERKMFHESQLLQLQLNYFCKTPEEELLQCWFSRIYLFALTAAESPWLSSWAPPSPARPSHGHPSLGKAGWQRFAFQEGGCFKQPLPRVVVVPGTHTSSLCAQGATESSHLESGSDPFIAIHTVIEGWSHGSAGEGRRQMKEGCSYLPNPLVHR